MFGIRFCYSSHFGDFWFYLSFTSSDPWTRDILNASRFSYSLALEIIPFFLPLNAEIIYLPD